MDRESMGARKVRANAFAHRAVVAALGLCMGLGAPVQALATTTSSDEVATTVASDSDEETLGERLEREHQERVEETKPAAAPAHGRPGDTVGVSAHLIASGDGQISLSNAGLDTDYVKVRKGTVKVFVDGEQVDGTVDVKNGKFDFTLDGVKDGSHIDLTWRISLDSELKPGQVLEDVVSMVCADGSVAEYDVEVGLARAPESYADIERVENADGTASVSARLSSADETTGAKLVLENADDAEDLKVMVNGRVVKSSIKDGSVRIGRLKATDSVEVTYTVPRDAVRTDGVTLVGNDETNEVATEIVMDGENAVTAHVTSQGTVLRDVDVSAQRQIRGVAVADDDDLTVEAAGEVEDIDEKKLDVEIEGERIEPEILGEEDEDKSLLIGNVNKGDSVFISTSITRDRVRTEGIEDDVTDDAEGTITAAPDLSEGVTVDRVDEDDAEEVDGAEDTVENETDTGTEGIETEDTTQDGVEESDGAESDEATDEADGEATDETEEGSSVELTNTGAANAETTEGTEGAEDAPVEGETPEGEAAEGTDGAELLSEVDKFEDASAGISLLSVNDDRQAVLNPTNVLGNNSASPSGNSNNNSSVGSTDEGSENVSNARDTVAFEFTANASDIAPGTTDGFKVTAKASSDVSNAKLAVSVPDSVQIDASSIKVTVSSGTTGSGRVTEAGDIECEAISIPNGETLTLTFDGTLSTEARVGSKVTLAATMTADGLQKLASSFPISVIDGIAVDLGGDGNGGEAQPAGSSSTSTGNNNASPSGGSSGSTSTSTSGSTGTSGLTSTTSGSRLGYTGDTPVQALASLVGAVCAACAACIMRYIKLGREAMGFKY